MILCYRCDAPQPLDTAPTEIISSLEVSLGVEEPTLVGESISIQCYIDAAQLGWANNLILLWGSFCICPSSIFLRQWTGVCSSDADRHISMEQE